MDQLSDMTLGLIDEAELQIMLGAGRDVVVDFYADWCVPCQMLTPELEELAARFSERFEFVQIDIDSNPGLALSLGVMSIPTVIRFTEGGKEVARSVGVVPAADLARLLRLGG